MEFMFVGIGGALGSVSRYSLGKFISEKNKSKFPIGTFVINITGAFLLGVVSQLSINHNIYLLLSDGFLGGYTTFSTFMYEGFNLFKGKNSINAFAYIFLTLFLGIIGYVLGAIVGKFL